MGELYPLGVKDVEAIARSRASRTMPNSIKYWLYAGCGVFAAGIIYWMFGGSWIAFGIMAVGVAVAWYSTYLADKRRKAMTLSLRREWYEEQRRQEAR